MAAVGLGADDVRALLPERVVVACENGPKSTTISGDANQVKVALANIKAAQRDTFARALKVEIAYHSHHMAALSGDYMRCLMDEFLKQNNETKLAEEKLQVPIFSSLRARKITEALEFGPQYWVDNLTSPVLFSSAVAQIVQEIKNPLFLEIGPHSTLQGPIREICSISSSKFSYVPTMLRGKNCTESFLSALGQLYQHGINIDFGMMYPAGKALTDIPAYPWSLKDTFWYEPRISKEWRLRPYGHHELLGRKVAESTTLNPSWRLVLAPEHVPWIFDHRVRDDAVVPFAAYVAMAGEAIRQLTGVEVGYSIRNAQVTTALVLGDTSAKEIVTALRQDRESDYWHFNISSYNGSNWITHCEGLVKAIEGEAHMAESPEALPRRADTARWFRTFANVGFNYGPKFQLLEGLTAATTNEAATASISTSEESMKGPFLFHPTSMDACLQLAIIAGAKGLPRNYTELKVPTQIEELEVFRGASSMQAIAQQTDDKSTMNVDCVADGRCLLRIRGLHFTLLPNEDEVSPDHTNGAYLEWRPDFDFTDESALLVKPASDEDGTRLLEEFSLLCILDATVRLKGKKASSLHFEKYGRWIAMKAVSVASGPSSVLGDVSKLLALSAADKKALIATKYRELLTVPSRAAYAVAIEQIHRNIEGLYTGSTDAAQLLMEDDILPDLYSAINFDYTDYIRSMSSSRPALRILEIGAGAGGTTATILSQLIKNASDLPPYLSYTYTDVSPGFFPQAKERFQDMPNMDYKVFDVSKDPLAQGLEANSYDIILAPYVVHATPFLQQTLKNFKTVLKPDGRLLLSEPATIGLAPNLIFGTFASWWSGEADGRPWEPFVSQDRWHVELKRSGFTGADHIVDDAPFPYRYWSTIITRPAAGTQNGSSKPVALITHEPSSSLSNALTEELENAGHVVTKRSLADEIPHDSNVIYTFDMEKPFLRSMNEQDWVTFKNFLATFQSSPSRKLLWLLPPAQKTCQDPNTGLSIGLLRSVRTEMGLSIATLEIDLDDPNLASQVAKVFDKTVIGSSHGKLSPDYEFIAEDGAIKIGRYVPFSIQSALKSHAPTLADGHVADLTFDPKAAYIVTGGLGGLGRAICSWMAERGARFITVISRSAGQSSDDKRFISELSSMGCQFTPVAGAVQDMEVVKTAVSQSQRPVKGVIHLAMVLRDALFPDMTYQDWIDGLSPKVDGCHNLHHALEGSGAAALDFFVVTSSIVATINVPGQANYNAANTYLESFCAFRRSQGLAASALAVSPIDDIGVVVDNDKARRNLRSNGLQFLTEREVLEYVHLAIVNSRPDSPIIMGLYSDVHLRDPSNYVAWKNDRRMGQYHNAPIKEDGAASASSSDENGLRDFLAAAAATPSALDTPESISFLAMEIGRRVYSFMLKPIEEVDVSVSLVEMGLDSLMAVEMRKLWNQMFGLNISVLEIMSLGALENFGKLAAQGLKQRLLIQAAP
ncbi:polyketide synthase dehydratase-domain-containing protein [Xylariaceae sp. FL1272]|nr:polyketide synthase dehydratase-domain-containing protein [Xylariaceae sp. FL1272]